MREEELDRCVGLGEQGMGVRKGARVSEEMNRVCSSLPLFLMLLGQLLGARSGREGAKGHQSMKEL